MKAIEIGRILDEVAQQFANGDRLGHFDYLDAIDTIEFLVLDRMEQGDGDGLGTIEERARELHARLKAAAKATTDQLVQDIRTGRMGRPEVRRLLEEHAADASARGASDGPDYDLFDDFLSDLLHVDIEPTETRERTEEMVALQPTPGRIVMEMIRAVPLTEQDRFYDLGSGLGRVPILVSLLTGARAVGIEYEPTYVDYARASAEKLGLDEVEFRNMDVREADLRDGTVFFLYTPFTGGILREVLNRLREVAAVRRITVCSYGPCTPIVEQETWLRNGQISLEDSYPLAILQNVAGSVDS